MKKVAPAPDQTQFSAESLLYESEDEGTSSSQPRFKKIFLIGGAILTVLSIVLVLVVSSRSAAPPDVIVEEDPVELTEIIVGPFNQRLSELKQELKLADPNQNSLPFPPVSSAISLEED